MKDEIYVYPRIGGTSAMAVEDNVDWRNQFEYETSCAGSQNYRLDWRERLEAVSPQLWESAADKELKLRFNRLADTWEEETQFLSSVDDIIVHPAHMEIIGMGEQAVPLILDRISQKGGLWFWALQFITGEDPVSENIKGNIKAMQRVWLEWGRKNGYC
jgi:hypothetical protein